MRHYARRMDAREILENYREHNPETAFFLAKCQALSSDGTKTVDSCKGQTREIFVTILLNFP